eukprot:c24749_g1_i7 orf=3-155(-)
MSSVKVMHCSLPSILNACSSLYSVCYMPLSAAAQFLEVTCKSVALFLFVHC